MREVKLRWSDPILLAEIEHAYQSASLHDVWHDEKQSVRAALSAIANSLGNGRYNPRKVLGVGGSGIVIRLADSLFPDQDNALKFPRPVPGRIDLIAELLSKEITHLARIRHPGIVRILHYDNARWGAVGKDKLPFYLMEAIDGTPSREYVRSQVTDTTQLLRLFRQTADVLLYLHEAQPDGLAHLDIKPDNFVVSSAGRAVMIDLGTCKQLAAPGAASDNTIIACTRSFAHPQLVQLLAKDPSDENRAKGEVARQQIDPRWDLWSYAMTLVSWLGIDPRSGEVEIPRLLNIVEPYVRKYILLLAARVLADNGPAWLPERIGLSRELLRQLPVPDAKTMRELIYRIDGTTSPLHEIPELKTARTGTIQTGRGTHVYITPALEEVFKHRLFRRLNAISQLGLVSQVYPGAKHSRREHSLGTYANVGRVIRNLYNDPDSPLFRQIVSSEDCRDLLLAALLHDLGQFPLAHDLEEIDDAVFNHAELTLSMLRGTWDKKKRGTSRLEFDSLEPVYQAWNTTSARVIDILGARSSNSSASPKQKLLRSLLSGPIDADKLDYLFRDARHLDLPYPFGVDVERLFQCITTVVVDRVEGGHTNVPALGIHSKGKVAAEFLSLARYAMFSQAYWHHAVRVQKAMLFRAVEALLSRLNATQVREMKTEFIELISSLPESLYSPLSEPGNLFDTPSAGGRLVATSKGSDLPATDAAVLSWLYTRLLKLQLPEAQLIDGILSRHFYKRLWVVSHDMDSAKWDLISEKWRRLSRTQKHDVSHQFELLIFRRLESGGIKPVTAMAATTALEKIAQMNSGNTPWLLVDIPGNRPGSDVGLHYVLETQRRQLRKDDRVVGHLQLSKVWEQYAKHLTKAAGKIRIFCHPAVSDVVEVSIPWIDGVQDLISVVERVDQ